MLLDLRKEAYMVIFLESVVGEWKNNLDKKLSNKIENAFQK